MKRSKLKKYLIKTKIKKIGANINLSEITVSISYVKQKTIL